MRSAAAVALLSLLVAGCATSKLAIHSPAIGSRELEAPSNTSVYDAPFNEASDSEGFLLKVPNACTEDKLASSIPAPKLIRALASELPRKKGKYERTADYKSKLQEAAESIVDRLGHSKYELAVTFPILPVFQSYDPDTETLKLYLTGVPPAFETPNAPRYIVAESYYTSHGSYLAHNGFGAEVTVTKGASRNLAVLWKTDWAALSPLPKISPAQARHLKRSLSVLLVGNLQLPFLFHTKVQKYSTYSMPDDDVDNLSVLMIHAKCAAVYDAKTKTILKSIGLDQGN